MPAQIGSLFVSLTADFNPFQRNMRAAEGVVATTAGGMRRSIGLTTQSVTGLQRSMNSGMRPYALISAARTFDTVQQRANLLRGALFATTAAFGGLGAALTTNVVSRYLDSYTGLENQLRVVSNGSADLAAQFEEVQNVAERSRSSLGAVAQLYSRIAKASPNEGADKLLRRVETVNKALQLGGATAQEASSAAIQFSQAIASNRLGGEELRAVLETPLGLELARGLGVTIGKFREMGFAGELTAEVLFRALDKISGTIDGQFARSISTIDQALTVVDGQITVYAGKLDDAYGITKLMTGAIRSFGDNLESIIPLLASVGLGLGTLFGGRLIGGAAGSGYGRIAAGIRSVTDARKEDLRLAREETYVAAARHRDATQTLADARAAAQSSESLAPRTLAKAYQRDLAAVTKADQAHLNLLSQKAVLTNQLAEITRTATVGEVRASEKIATQQAKLNDLYAKGRQLKLEERKASNAVTGAAGLQAGTSANLRGVAEAERALNKVKAEQITLARSIAAEEKALATTRGVLTKQFNASFVAAANERAAVLVRERQLNADLAKSDATRASLVGAARTSRGAAQAAGATVAAENIGRSARALQSAELAGIRAASGLSLATRAAGGLNTALGLVRVAGGSLVTFLGGPWGVIFTGAIAAMTVLGLKARETAEEIARAQAIINEELEAAGQGIGTVTPEEQTSILQGRIVAQTERLQTVTKELERVRGEIVTSINALVNDPRVAGLPNSDEISREIFKISEAFQASKISIDEVRERLTALGVNASSLDAVTNELKKNENQADLAAFAVKRIQEAIRALDGQQATIRVNFDVNDPMGILGFTDFKKKQAAEIEDRASYGQAQTAMRNQMELLRMRQRVMGAAGEEDKVKNTATKIRDRADALFEEGAALGMTREQASALAREELNLTEQTRLAGLSGGGAAKEYEKFANKLAELKAAAEGASLGAIDQQVINFAESLKNGSALMRQYIDAVKGGDLSKAPKELLEARQAFLATASAEQAKQIVQQYGTGAQLAAQFAEQQEILNIAVANGSITAGQAAVAYADFLGQFGGYEWIDQISSAITGFAESAIFDFENIEDAAKNLVTQIGKIILQATLLKPLESWLSGLFGGATGGLGGIFGGGGLGAFPAAPMVGGLYHSGTLNAQPGGVGRAVPASAFARAPRFHSGNIKGNEMAAILQRGEGVLRQRDMGRTVGLIGGMANRLRSGGGGDIKIEFIDQVGVKKRTERSSGPDGDVLRVMIEDVVDAGVGRGRFDNSMGGRFGARPTPIKR